MANGTALTDYWLIQNKSAAGGAATVTRAALAGFRHVAKRVFCSIAADGAIGIVNLQGYDVAG